MAPSPSGGARRPTASGDVRLPDVPLTRSHRLCSNRAATRVNLLNTREKRVRRKTIFCRAFASSRNLQQTSALPSHGRGRWFDRASPTTELFAKPAILVITNSSGLCSNRHPAYGLRTNSSSRRRVYSVGRPGACVVEWVRRSVATGEVPCLARSTYFPRHRPN